MSEKIIIDNRTNLPMSEVFLYIKDVIAQGRISNSGKSYRYVTVWQNGLVVYATNSGDTDTFEVIMEQKQ